MKLDKKYIDPVTGLPHQLLFMEELESRLIQDRSLGLLIVSVHGLDPIEESSGPQVYDEAMAQIAKDLSSQRGQLIREKDLIATVDIGVPSFLIFLSESRQDREEPYLTKENVEGVARRIEDYLSPRAHQLVSKFSKDAPKVVVGHALVVHNPLIRARRLIYRLIEEAKQMARLAVPMSKIKNKERLQSIILSENITTVFQPIMYLDTEKPMGYEALTRGPKGTIFESPLTLFSIAKSVGLIFELDRICRRKALQAAQTLPKDCKIFVNSLPATIHDPEFRGEFLKSFLKDVDRSPSNIVFEINERSAIDNYASFREAIKYYTDIGMSIAIDDTGTGYSTLEAIVELKPQYLKFDISMVRGIHKDTLKQEMLKMLTLFAEKIQAEIIAEGIEEKEDLEMLKEMGLNLGQGYYFAKPMPPSEIK